MEIVTNTLSGPQILSKAYDSEQGTDINFHVRDCYGQWTVIKAHSAIVIPREHWLMNSDHCKRNEKGSFDVIFDGISLNDLQNALKVIYLGETSDLNKMRVDEIMHILKTFFGTENVEKIDIPVDTIDQEEASESTEETDQLTDVHDFIEVKMEEMSEDEDNENELNDDCHGKDLFQEPEAKRPKLHNNQRGKSKRLKVDPEDLEDDSELVDTESETSKLFAELSEKSMKKYKKFWEDFQNFRKTPKSDAPVEEDYLEYFKWLHDEKKWAGTTIMTTCAALNFTHQKLFTGKPKKWPRISKLIKSYNMYEPKSAETFSLAEIQSFMKKEVEGPYWILRKAVVAVAFCGGLSSSEAGKIFYGDLQQIGDAFLITSKRAKKSKDDMVVNITHIPKNQRDPTVCFYTKLQNYIDAVEWSLGPFERTDRLFKCCFKSSRTKDRYKFHNTPFGLNQLAQIGKEVAELLGLPNPDAYTGHCWKRSVKNRSVKAVMQSTERWSSVEEENDDSNVYESV